ncbi:MAG: hypothetical protein M1828_007256 [Chrysothrix sp. TS-e1954]|nr:MAG: hypothetical protein M1828_007256 [Chrysothrix sp. TS-e1954]
MVGQIPEGYVGNLTPEHEAKLKEFWEALMKITGVNVPKANEAENSASHHENGAEAGGKKKKRFGMFRRGGGGGDDAANAEDSEDKYGQTKEFKQALADQTPEEMRETLWAFSKMDDPDKIFLRYLRARKWNVQNALIMLISTNHWRSKEMHLDDRIISRGEAWYLEKSQSGTAEEKKLGHDLLSQFRMGKSFIHGTDNEGRPISWVRARLHKAGEQSVESLEVFTVYMIETCRLMLSPDPPADTGDYTPVKFMIKCFEANYPESLGAMCVFRAPWIFHGIWSIIKGWLDPVVAAKVHFMKDAHELTSLVPMSHIPKELGGEEDWTYTYKEPVPGENSEMADESAKAELLKERWRYVEEYETETLKWCRGEGDEQAVKKRRSELVANMKSSYWKLDPYVRAKTVYDRTGVIGAGGSIDMYPEKTRTATSTQHNDDVD